MEKFEAKKANFAAVAAKINGIYGEGTLEIEIKDSYYNMKEKIEPCMYIVDRAKEAMEELGIKPVVVPIRGGTDGARLSFMGLPCPNLCTGGENFHSRFEFVSVESMEKISDILVKIIENAAK
jgi:tripeptide aminopeptidase